jgi:hypothetical protein
LAAEGVKNEKAASFFGVTAVVTEVEDGVGVGAPNVNPVFGVTAAFRLEKNAAVAWSGLDGFAVGVTVVSTLKGEAEKVENGEFLTSATLETTGLIAGAADVVGVMLTEMVGVLRMGDLIRAAVDFGVVAATA